MSQQEWATPSGPPPPTQDTTSLVAAALLSRQSRNTMTSILIRSDLLTSEQPLISRRHERREEGVGLRTRTGWVGVVGWGGRAAPQHAGLCRGWTRGGLATAPRAGVGVDTGRPGHRPQGWHRGGPGEAWPPPPGCLVGSLETLCLCVWLGGRLPIPRSGCVSTSPSGDLQQSPLSLRQSLSSGDPQGDCPGWHVLCLMDLVLTAAASEALIKGHVGALPAS